MHRTYLLAALLAAAGLLAVARPITAQEAPAAPAAKEDPITITIGPDGVSLFALSADAHELFTRLAKATGLRIIVDDTVKRTITANLVNRKVSDIVESLCTSYGFACRQVNGVYMVADGLPKSVASYLLSDIDSIRTQYVLAPNAKSLLPIFLQDHVKTSAELNAVILSAPPDILRKFREDIKQFDIPASQIMVEVLMVEFSETGATEFGLSSILSNAGREITVDGPGGLISFHAITSLPRQFAASLHAMVTAGKARVRACPRVATVSGQRASVFIGKQRYLSTPVQISGSNEYDSRIANSIDAGVRLNITPWTGGEDEIIVDVSPEISVLSAPDAKTGLPERSTRRANTTVRVRNGETIIIGGLTQQESMVTHTKIPILGDLPLLGPLFRTRDDTDRKTEMAIFITPRMLSTTGHLPAEEEARARDQFLKETTVKPGPARP